MVLFWVEVSLLDEWEGWTIASGRGAQQPQQMWDEMVGEGEGLKEVLGIFWVEQEEEEGVAEGWRAWSWG